MATVFSGIGFLIADHGVEGDEQLPGDGDDGELFGAGSGGDGLEEGTEAGGFADGAEGGHVEGAPRPRAAAANGAFSTAVAAVVVGRCKAGETGDCVGR